MKKGENDMVTKTTNEEINEAIKEVEIAQNHFDNADIMFVESAGLRLTSAQERLNALLKIARDS